MEACCVYALRKLLKVCVKQFLFRQKILFALRDGFGPITDDWHLELNVFDRLVRPSYRLKPVLFHIETTYSAEPELLKKDNLRHVHMASVLC